nr:cyclic peptide export ABC transporter [Ruminiclostridium josui]
MGLNGTLLDRHEAYSKANMATGYKPGFLRAQEYYAPTFRGNTPAGYFIMDSGEMEKWLKIQMLSYNLPEKYIDLIKKSHIPDRTVSPTDGGSSYAAGWEIYQKGSGEISHAGSNPNFASYITFRPEDKVGVAVLANLNSDFTGAIARGIMDIIMDRKLYNKTVDMMLSIDNIAFTIFCVSILLFVLTVVFLVIFVLELIRKKRKVISTKQANYIGLFITLISIVGLGYCLYIIPRVLYNGLNWNFVSVWAPSSFIPCTISLFATSIVFLAYFQLDNLFPKKKDKPFFPLIVLSFISGFGNAFIIFVINEALNRKNAIQSGLLFYFFLGIMLYVFGQKLIRKEMIRLMNNIIYDKRIELIEKTLRMPYYEFEKIESGKIHTGLNNDTETISRLPGVTIGALTGIATLLCCFVYLGTINIFGLLLSVLIIIIAAGLYYIIGKSANKLWEKTRDIQNVFIQFINDFIQGFKELTLKVAKRKDFRDDMESCCAEYKEKNIAASDKFVNVFVIGELLFTFVIGAVAFVFPLIFDNIQTDSLRAYIFVFLYMTNPIHSVLDNIPEIFRIRVSWKRINELIEKLPQDNTIKLIEEVNKNIKDIISSEGVNIRLDNVKYTYCNDDNKFIVGPINLAFQAGEITFITGGNGSGKTTLAKLITGLYKPDSGSIIIENKKMGYRELGEYYSTVFSDYYLFNKLYGIDYEKKVEETDKLLIMLQIDKKLGVKDGEFSTIQLSTGQRKRVALLVSYLEDRGVFLFDEWAADQDPLFKKYFYESLLPQLKKANKCVIAITHDDHYFHTADKIIKLNMGKVDEVNIKNKEKTGGIYATEIM